jgi:hypothetical protein
VSLGEKKAAPNFVRVYTTMPSETILLSITAPVCVRVNERERERERE